MKTKKLSPAFLFAMSIVLFASCNKIKEISITEQKSIKLDVETEVKANAATYSSLRAGEMSAFSGTANFSLSEMPELKGFNLSSLSAATLANVTIETSCTEEGDYYAENVLIQTTGASATISNIVIGESITGNSEVNALIQTLLTNLVSGKTMPVSISGTTNLNNPGKKIIYKLNIDAKWTLKPFDK